MSLYSQRGVSAQKEEVHAAIKKLDAGLYANAFCKMYPDYLGGDDNYVNISHADGAGTKSILAYLYWKETGDVSVWKGIAQDAVAMNLDDLLCVGVLDNLLFSSTIDRNKSVISGEVLEALSPPPGPHSRSPSRPAQCSTPMRWPIWAPASRSPAATACESPRRFGSAPIPPRRSVISRPDSPRRSPPGLPRVSRR